MAGQSKLVISYGVGLLSAIYGIYHILKNLFQKDEFFKSCKWKGGGPQRRILILGLRQSGKSRLLQCFQRYLTVYNTLPTPVPTIGYNIHSVGLCGVDFHFWEGGGICNGDKVTDHLGIPSNIDVIVWVVDSSMSSMLHASRTALHRFIRTYDAMTTHESKNCDDHYVMYGIPVVIVATKMDKAGSVSASQVLLKMETDDIQKCHKVYIVGTQDKAGSVSASQVLLKMETDDIQKCHKVYIVGTQVPDRGQRKGLWRLYELLAYAEKNRYQLDK